MECLITKLKNVVEDQEIAKIDSVYFKLPSSVTSFNVGAIEADKCQYKFYGATNSAGKTEGFISATSSNDYGSVVNVVTSNDFYYVEFTNKHLIKGFYVPNAEFIKGLGYLPSIKTMRISKAKDTDGILNSPIDLVSLNYPLLTSARINGASFSVEFECMEFCSLQRTILGKESGEFEFVYGAHALLNGKLAYFNSRLATIGWEGDKIYVKVVAATTANVDTVFYIGYTGAEVSEKLADGGSWYGFRPIDCSD